MYTGPVALKVSAPGGQADPRVAPLIKAGRNLLGEMETRAQIAGPTAMAATRGSKENGTVYARWTPYVKSLNVEVVKSPSEDSERVVDEESQQLVIKFQRATEVYREEDYTSYSFEDFNSQEDDERNAAKEEFKNYSSKSAFKSNAVDYTRITRIMFELIDGKILELKLTGVGVYSTFKFLTSRGQKLSKDSQGRPVSDYVWNGGERERYIQYFKGQPFGVTSEMVFYPEEVRVYPDSLNTSIQINTKFNVEGPSKNPSNFYEETDSSSILFNRGEGEPWEEFTREQSFVYVNNQGFYRTNSITFYRILGNEKQFLRFDYVEPTPPPEIEY